MDHDSSLIHKWNKCWQPMIIIKSISSIQMQQHPCQSLWHGIKTNPKMAFILQKSACPARDTTRMMVYYWFEQKERRVAWDFAAKFWLMVDGIQTGQTDGALVRMTTPINVGETDEAAEERLKSMLDELIEPLPRFVPSGV